MNGGDHMDENEQRIAAAKLEWTNAIRRMNEVEDALQALKTMRECLLREDAYLGAKLDLLRKEFPGVFPE